MFTKDDVLDAGRFRIHVPANNRIGGANGVPQYTYLVDYVPAKGRYKDAWFVKLQPVCGKPLYMGKLDDFTGQVEPTAASKVPANDFPFRLLNKVLARLWAPTPDLSVILAAGYGLENLNVPAVAAAPVAAPAAVKMAPAGPDRHGQYDDEKLADWNESQLEEPNALDHEFTNRLTEEDSWYQEVGQYLDREPQPLPDAKIPQPAPAPAKIPQPAPAPAKKPAAMAKELDAELLRRILPNGNEPWARR